MSRATWHENQVQVHHVDPQGPTFCGFLIAEVPRHTPTPFDSTLLPLASSKRKPNLRVAKICSKMILHHLEYQKKWCGSAWTPFNPEGEGEQGGAWERKGGEVGDERERRCYLLGEEHDCWGVHEREAREWRLGDEMDEDEDDLPPLTRGRDKL